MDIKMSQNTALAALVSLEQDRKDWLAENRELIQAVRSVNQAEMLGENNELSYKLDREAHRVVMRIVNRKTNEVVRQVPPEYVLQLARELRQQRG